MTHGVTLGYLEQNAKLDPTLDIYGEMRSCFAHVLDAMAQMQILERRMAASPEDASLLEQHDALQNIIDAADGYNMDVNIKKVLSGMGFAQDTWTKNIAVLSGGELTRLRLAKLLLEKPDVLILDEPTAGLDPIGAAAFDQLIRDLSDDLDLTVFMITHDLDSLYAICDQVAVLADKHVVAKAPAPMAAPLLSPPMAAPASAPTAVPTAALVQLEGKTVVFQRTADGVEPVEVQVGSIVGERTEITAGLAAGDSIAVTGAFTLKSRQLKSQMGEGHGH